MKTTIKPGFAAFVLLMSASCTKESIHNPVPVSAQQEYNASIEKDSFYIGQYYGGGIIFFLDNTKNHGLIAATADLEYIRNPWFHGHYKVTGATSKSDGMSNTEKIVNVQGDSGKYAALKCAEYTGEGYTDWYLPSKQELNRLYQQKDIVGGFADESPSKPYWSSTEYDFANAWCQFFDTGLQRINSKANVFSYVRPIRAF